jgi:hypothetical protein
MVGKSTINNHGKLGNPLVNVNKKQWKTTMLLMGKSTISIAMFNSYVTNYRRVTTITCPRGIKLVFFASNLLLWMKRWILCSDLTWAIKRCSQRLLEVLKWNFHVLKIQKQTNYEQFWKLAEFKAQVLEVVDVGESNDSTSNGRDSRSLVWKGTSIRTGGCTSGEKTPSHAISCVPKVCTQAPQAEPIT